MGASEKQECCQHKRPPTEGHRAEKWNTDENFPYFKNLVKSFISLLPGMLRSNMQI